MSPRAPVSIRVVFVDDDAGLCKLVAILLDWEEDIELVGVARTGTQAIRMARELAPDVLITDVRLPDISGIEVGNRVSKECPEMRLLLISGHTAGDLREELKMSIFTFVEKHRAFHDFPALIRRVAE